ncbi:solute carrier family 22 member 3-like [Anticarsia gemmatalis]|uniref:solute carrier family 22 member 3-like n=1 Tax=Anticarsia gemmatalis TaxID=129554 RepID=UPI003F7775C3
MLMSLLKIPIAWFQLNIIFMAPPQDFWCEKPPMFTKLTDQEWRKICSPRVQEFPCLIFDPDIILFDPTFDKTLVPLVPCPKFVYDTSMFKRTITSEWDLVCSKRWRTHLCQCVMMWGILVGGVIFGVLADKYGRRIPLMCALFMQGVTSLLASVIPWFWVFLTDWFILALANGGISVVSFVLCMEVVSGKWRTIIPVLYQLPFGLGNAIMAGLAYWLRDWRKLGIALSMLSSLYIFYWFWIPESPKWLIATGQTEKALEILQEAAIMNGRPISRRYIRILKNNYLIGHSKKPPGFIAFIKSKNLRTKTILLAINWFCTGLSFYTFAQYLGSIGGNVFVSVGMTGVISALGGLTCVFVLARVGRKTAVGIYQLITSSCFILILLIPRDPESDWLRLLFAGIGFGGMAGTIPALYLFTGELFPTLGRNVGVSGVTTFARIASMIAPAVVTLESVMVDLPLIIVAIISLCQILLVLPLPETKDVPLPETLEEAEHI